MSAACGAGGLSLSLSGLEGGRPPYPGPCSLLGQTYWSTRGTRGNREAMGHNAPCNPLPYVGYG